MKDNGRVISTKAELAQVDVNCFEACHDCSAKSLCAGYKHSKGQLSVKNPIQARPGDQVQIEIPETQYSKALILLFGSLLLAALAGMSIGYSISKFLSLASVESSLAGFFLGLILAGFWLFRYFHNKKKEHLYPVIVNIIKKEGSYG